MAISYRRWTPSEDAELALRWADTSKDELAEQLGRCLGSIESRGYTLGFRKRGIVYKRPPRRFAIVNFESLQELVVRPGIEKKLVPLLAYRGNTSLGSVQRKWNLVLQMMLADATSIWDGVKIWREEDQSKLCGPEKEPVSMYLNGFFERMRDNPKVTDNIPGLTEYVEYLHPGQCLLTRVSIISNRRNAAFWRKYKAPDSKLRELRISPYAHHYPFLVHDTKRVDWGRDLTTKINALVPRGLPPDIRADVSQDLIIDILEGNLTLDEIDGNMKGAVRKVFKMHPTKYGPLSLDAPLPGMNDVRLMDVISDERGVEYD